MSVDALYRSTPTADGRPPARRYSERTANEQSQLDDILQDLLTDPLFVNNTRGFEWSNSADGTYGSISPHQGSITTHSGHGGRTVVSWQTSQNAGVAAGGRRSVDLPSPDAVFEKETSRRVETSSASRRPGSADRADERSMTAGGRYESRRVETRTEASTTRREGTASTGATESSSSRRGQPPPPPVRRRMFSPEMFNHESAAPTSRPAPIRREPEIAPTTASTTKTQPSRGQNFSPTSYNRNYSSDTEELGQSSSSSKWLEEQRGKLQSSRQQQQRGSRPGPGSAAAQSDTEDYYFRSSSTDRRGAGGRGGSNDFSPSTSRRRPYAFDDPYLSDSGYEVASRRPQQYASQTIQPTPHNRSADTRAYDLESGRLFETKRTFFVSGIERPPRCNSAQQTKYTFSVSPQRSVAGDEFPVSRPPPTQRPITPSRSCTSPVLPPLRTDSSREAAMRVHAVKEAPPAPPPRQARDTHSPSLDDLEKSLKDVHVLLQAPPPPRPAPSPTIDDLVTANKLKPEDADIEEEVIQLKPIGPGVQNLEFEGHTRHRSVTPGFPMEPVTPPFPASRHATSMHQGYSSVNDVRSATLPAAQPAPPSDFGKYMDEFNRLTESDTLTKSHLSGPSQMKQPAQAPPPQPAPEDLGRLLEEFNTLTEVNTLQKSPPMAPIQQQVSAMTNAAPSGNFMVGSSGPRVEESSTLTRQTVVMQQAATPMTSYAANDADMHIYQTPRRQYPQQQIQPQAQLQQQLAGSSQNFASDSLLRNQNISTMQRQQQFVTEQRQATLPYQQQQQQYRITEQQGTVAPASFQLQQPAVQAASFQQSYATNYQSPPVNTLQRQQQQQQQFQETFSQQGMQHGQMTGTGMSGLQQADGMRFSQQDVHSGMAGQQGYRGTEQQRVQSSTVQYATVTGGPHRGRTMSEGHWQQQQQNGQHPAVVEDFNASRVNQNYAQKASTLMAQRSTSLVEGRQDASGSGLLTVTTRAFSPSTLAAPLSASSGRISPGDMTLQARLQSRLNTRSPGMATMAGRASPTVYFGQSRTGSLNSLQDGGEVLQNSPRFVRDSSKLWHKPHITREEAITMLKDKPAGSFIVRNSNTFQGAFGLAVKVSQLPPNVHIKEGVDPQTELVRHFLIEPTSRGVRLKGCSNEPVFGSLAALVYQHTVTPLALPCKLLLPDVDVSEIDTVDAGTTNAANKSLLYVQGAACNVLYINSVDMESLTGPEALSRAINMTFLSSGTPPQATDVHFKVSSEGITLTDNKHRLFFRRHYPINTITFCGVDAKDRRWTVKTDDSQTADCKVFGFVARKSGVANDNTCHVFAEIDPNQPANAIVNFLTKVMIGQGHFMKT